MMLLCPTPFAVNLLHRFPNRLSLHCRHTEDPTSDSRGNFLVVCLGEGMLFSCVLGSRCQKRAFGGFHGSSFPLLEPQAATGDTLKAQEGKSIHPTHLEPAKPAGPLLDLFLLVVICQVRLSEKLGRAGDASPFGERLGWTRGGEPQCVWRWRGAVSIPPLRRLRAVPDGCAAALASPGAICQCHGHPAPAEHDGKRKH